MLNKKLLGSVSSLPSDANFENVSLLLNGDGTNGAQNNTFLDSSTNNFTITRNGNTTQGSFSPYGSLWSNFLPSGSNLSLSGTAVGTSDATVEFFIFPTDSSTTYRGVFDNRTSGGTNTGFGIFQYGLTIEVYGNGLKVSSAASALNINKWNHVALTRSSGTCQLYINGVASGSSGSYSDNLTSTSVKIGDDPANIYPYVGYISNLRLVIGSVVYTGSYTVPTTPLTAISGTSLLTCQSNRFIDNSSNNRTITVTGSPSVQRFSPFNPTAEYSTSVIGGSGYLNGSSTLNTPTSANVSFGSNDWTVDFWVYASSYSNASQGTVWDNRYNASTGICINVFSGGYVSAGQISINTNSSAAVASGGNLIANAWNFVRVVRSSGVIYGYTNGVSAFTYSDSRTYGSPTRIYNGSDWTGASLFTGYVSDLRQIDGTALSGTVIPTAPLTAVTNTQLLLSYTNAGIPDLAMQNNLETVGNAQVSTSVKKYGTGSLAFDGSGDVLISKEIGGIYTYGTGDYTVECWIYPTTGTTNQKVILGRESTGDIAVPYIYLVASTGYLALYYSSANTVSTSSAIQQNTWTHIAVCRASGTSRIFVNGIQDGSATDTTNIISPNFITIGASGAAASVPFTGYIDDMRITKGVARYTANFTPPTKALETF